LDRLYTYLQQQPYDWEILVVSNGCTDDTDGAVRRAACTIPNLELISVPERGKGLASKDGALRSRGEVVFLCDADLSMPPEELAGFLTALESADVVAGSREAPGAHRYDEPWYRHVIGRVFNYLVRLLAVPGIQDTQCGFKAFRRNVARHLFGKQMLVGFGFDVELLFLARKFGYAIEELPIDWYFDADTRVRPGIDSLRMLGEVLYIRLGDALGQYRARDASPGTRREDIGG
jgi:dolichyl-phosphate beta-glucosyltransferase